MVAGEQGALRVASIGGGPIGFPALSAPKYLGDTIPMRTNERPPLVSLYDVVKISLSVFI